MSRTMKQRITGLGAFAGLVVAAGMLAAPAAGAVGSGSGPVGPANSMTAAAALNGPALLHEAGAPGTCAISGGSLDWGVKESFRSYISSSIAKGEWTVSDGVSYATPSFTWTGASGELHTADGSGSASFAGAVTFTGHGGVLNMVVGNPTLEFAADGTARLLVDARSNDSTGALVIDEKQAELATVKLPAPVVTETGTVTLTDLPLMLTAAGVPVFGNFYEAGAELDPITVSFELECVAAEQTDAGSGSGNGGNGSSASGSDAAPINAESGGSDIPWPGIIVGTVAALLGVVAAIVVVRRKRAGADESSGTGGASDV